MLPETHRLSETPRKIWLATGWPLLNAGINFQFAVDFRRPALHRLNISQDFHGANFTGGIDHQFPSADSDCASSISYMRHWRRTLHQIGFGRRNFLLKLHATLGVSPGVADTTTVPSKIFA